MKEVGQPALLLLWRDRASQTVDPAAGFFDIIHAVECDQPTTSYVLDFCAKVDLGV